MTEKIEKKIKETSNFLKRKIKKLIKIRDKLHDEDNKTREQLNYYRALELRQRLDKKQIKKLK